VVFRIKQLLYDEGFTIAGAKKKLASEVRGGAKLKVVTSEIVELTAPEIKVEEIIAEPVLEQIAKVELPKEVIAEPITMAATASVEQAKPILTPEQKIALRQIKEDLQGLLTRLSRGAIITAK